MYEKIEPIIADHFGVTRDEMISGKDRPSTDARHFLWYILHYILGYSGNTIAKHYNVAVRGIYNYSSLIKAGIDTQPFYSMHFQEIQSQLKLLDIV